MDITKDNSRHGTTTIGLVCADGVLLAADKRASMGYMVSSKTVNKVLPITDKIAITIAGLVGDAQMVGKYLRAEIELYEVRRQRKATVKSAATLLSNIMFGQRPFPFYVQLLIAGHDEKGSHLYSLDPSGSLIGDDYISTGSGSVFAYGVLEDKFKENLPLKDALHVVSRALRAALARDIATGEGMDIWLINGKGIKKFTKNEIEKAIA